MPSYCFHLFWTIFDINTHTFERNTIETNEREKIFSFFLHIIIFYSGKIQINESRFLTEIYDIFSPFEVTWNILSHVLKSNKPVKAFQRRNLGYFFIVLNKYRLNPEIFIDIK